MAFSKLFTMMVSFAIVMLLDLAIKTGACRCRQVTACQALEVSDAVLKVTTLSRSAEEEAYKSVTYIAKVDIVYKGDPTLRQEISVTTAWDTGGCGLPLEVGGEYLLGLSGGEGKFTGSTCGYWSTWGFGLERDVVSLEAGCVNVGNGGESMVVAEASASGTHDAKVAPSVCEEKEL